MKIYIENNTEISDVEVTMTGQELKALVNALAEFESKIQQFKTDNKEKRDLGFTHIHLKDHIQASTENKSDIVFYVDLDSK